MPRRALQSVGSTGQQGGGNMVQNMGLVPLPQEERFPLFVLIGLEVIGLILLRRYIGGHRG